MELWRRVFREGIAPQLPLAALEALRRGLLKNDPRLRPGSTVEAGWTMGGFGIIQACAIGYGGWKGARLETAGDVEAFFADVCAAANEILGDPAACGGFISWFDNHPRAVVFPLLLSEVNRAIAARTDESARALTSPLLRSQISLEQDSPESTPPERVSTEHEPNIQVANRADKR